MLLVDKSSFPRGKACGGCLGSSAVASLGSIGLGDIPGRLGEKLERFELAAGTARAALRVCGGVAMPRERLDAEMIGAAVEAGAEFLPATVGALHCENSAEVVVALRPATDPGSEFGKSAAVSSLVIAADGLSGTSLVNHPEFAASSNESSLMGVSGTLGDADWCDRRGTIFMTCGVGGYVGAVRFIDGHLHVAAALDPGFVRSRGGPTGAVNEILASAGMPLFDVPATFRWRGAPPLTRQRALIARGRVFVAGDAAGYVEPFTGEGMGWAIDSGIALAPLAIKKLHRAEFDAAGAWIERHSRIVGRRQRVCALLAACLKRPRLTRCAVRLLGFLPVGAWPLVRSVQRTACTADPAL